MSSDRPSTPRVDAIDEWRASLNLINSAVLAFLAGSGLLVYLAPEGTWPQLTLIAHTVVGLLALPLAFAYLVLHWLRRGSGNLNHYQLLGYLAAALWLACLISGIWLTEQAVLGDRLAPAWDSTHLITGLLLPLLLATHLATVMARRLGASDAAKRLRAARRYYLQVSLLGGIGLLLLPLAWHLGYSSPSRLQPFPQDYSWSFGPDRPFAPSLSRVDLGDWQGSLRREVEGLLQASQRDQFARAIAALEAERTSPHYGGQAGGPFALMRAAFAQVQDTSSAQREGLDRRLQEAADRLRSGGALEPATLAGSERCGDCHEQIYREWLPSAHRYSSMDDLFQVVQTLMSEETTPEHTRYCAGCHDPISLFAGAKDSGNITLSSEGAHEGISCTVCHSIVQADVQGNGDFTIAPPRHYVYEEQAGALARWTTDFLIRAYPRQHVTDYSRPLYKTAVYCGACHKQYMDIDLNTDIGRVQGQNQYDSWARSRWHVEGDPQSSVECRECHMPLVPSTDPAAGDPQDYNRSPKDGMHRGHRFLGGNQYVPLLHALEGAEEHVKLTEAWLRGDIEIPEIADKWSSGPVVRMELDVPAEVARGATAKVRVVLTNNKTGHDFPTGPLDMIESWVELRVEDERGRLLHHSGGRDERDAVLNSVAWFKADGFDREGGLIDRHNLWDLVGKSYSRSLYPGMTDMVEIPVECQAITLQRAALGLGSGTVIADPRSPTAQRIDEFEFAVGNDDTWQAVGALRVDAILWYRKANPDFLDRVYGVEAAMRAPLTEINRAHAAIRVLSPDPVDAH